MRPIELKMKYFGPYQNETVDFSSFNTNPLFLISGPTGSGKTTIFDALTFALYGKTSCNDERPGTDLRSKFAKPDQITEVSLKFSHQGQNYKVWRRPQQLLAKKRGTGLTSMPAKARLTIIEKDGEKQEFERLREVDQKIINLLQLDSDQFRQIVLLPQGDFRKFLGADSDNKEVLLRKLFGTHLYERWANALKEKQIAVKKQLQQEVITLQAINDQFMWDEKKSDLLLPDVLISMESENKKMKERVAELRKTADKSQKNYQTVTKEFAEAQTLVEAFKQIEKSKAILVELAFKAENMKELAKEIECNEWVEKHQGQYQNFQQGLTDIEKISRKLATFKKELPSLKEKELEALKTKNKLEKQLLDIDNEKNKLHDLLIAQKKVEKLNVIDQEIVKLQKLIVEQNSKISIEAQKLDQVKKEIKQLRTEIQSDKLTRKIEKANQLTQQANSIQSDFEIYLSYQTQMAEVKDKLAQFKKELSEKIQNANKAQNEYDILNDQALISQINILASKLSPEAPCPVCGSLKHPTPAQGAKTDFDSRALAEADQERQRTQNELVTVQKDVNQYQKHLTELENEAASIGEKLFTLLVVPENSNLSDEVMKLNKRVSDEQRNVKRLEQLRRDQQQALRQNEDLQESTQEKLSEYKEQLNKQQVELTEKTATIKTLKTSMPSIADEKFLNEEIEKTNLKIKNFEKAQKTNQDLVTIFHEKVTTTQTNIESTTKQLMERKDQNKKQLAEFNEAMLIQGTIKDMYDYQNRLNYLTKLPEQKNQLKLYQEAKLRANTELLNAQKRTAEKTSPDLQKLEEELKKAQTKAQSDQQALTIAGQKLANNEILTEKFAKLWQKNQEALNDSAKLNSLVEIMTGSGSKKVSLERYVLQAYLNQVLQVANDQLSQMTHGRYQFILDDEQGSYKKNSGLEINVYDDQVGSIRSVHTLSGGESFLAALSLALALAQVIQEESGGVRIEALFIDEGFGALDEGSLSESLTALEDLQESSRLIGIISHVQGLLTQIPDQLQVRPTGSGNSHLKIVHLAA